MMMKFCVLLFIVQVFTMFIKPSEGGGESDKNTLSIPKGPQYFKSKNHEYDAIYYILNDNWKPFSKNFRNCKVALGVQ
uniref:Uncharacterized protein n=1 Tax=Trichobilharzia regenti TaxID=157069 RepID=A0AA85IS03_TRIRE|nr:unnamed protein product [Trichobilharzia regenti]